MTKMVDITETIEKLAKEREVARQKKDWKESDKLRDQINKLGFEIEDKKTGYKLKKITK